MDPGAVYFPGPDRNRHRHDATLRRSSSGACLVADVPHGHWRTTTLVAGLRQAGIVAPLVLNGPLTGIAFRAYVEQFLAPTP